MKKLRHILIFSSLLSCLVILAIGLWFFRLNQRITEGLAEKKFLPPTEYYAAPEMILSSSSISRTVFLQKISEHHYRERTAEQNLFPGDFQTLNQEGCQQLFQRYSNSGNLNDGTTSCVALKAKSSGDPWLQNDPLQIMTFDAEEISHQILRQNNSVLEMAPSIVFESELIAQYLDKQPIMQNYRALGEVPPQCTNAVLAIEDSQFLDHSGVSYTGIARAIISNLFGHGIKQGGSTITQQMVKNYFLTSERTLKRKATEFAMSLLLEAHASKDEILETYLNIIYLGQNGPFQIRGFGSAAQYYFHKQLDELNLPECATLAAVLNSPGLYDPFRKPQNAIKRRNLVLERMFSLQMITADEKNQAQAQALPTTTSSNLYETAPYYLNAVNSELEKKFGNDIGGLKIFTGLSLNDQKAAQESVRQHLERLEKENKKILSLKQKGQTLEGAFISADNQTGLITAIVGGRSYKLTQFNRAIDGHRQVGSIMKPFVYLTALMQSDKYNPSTILHDTPFTHKYQNQSWSPENYGKKYFGDVPMFFALKSSLNAATASLGIEIGIDKIIETAKTLGLTSDLPNIPSLTLGSLELYPYEVLQAYSTMARLGSELPLTTVRAVVQKDKILFKNEPQATQKIEKKIMASLVSMMQQTVKNGTAQAINNSGFKIPAAGKTGTTSDSKDAWFAGFTARKTSVAWVGYDTPTPNGLTGASGAVPIWLQFMKQVTENDSMQNEDFPWPEDINRKTITFTEPISEESPTPKTTEADLIFAN